ncbi:MAG TPA: DinB family protein [Longimicrobium sp.]|nr:DinB family protein [Longimicrobium sp.]
MPAAPPRDEARWRTAIEEHQAALADYLETVEKLPEAAWRTPWAPGKWTPAQITEHLAMVYEAMLREVRDGEPMKTRVSPFRQRLLRWFLLSHMLYHRTFPLRAPAPREARPRGEGQPHGEALARLRRSVDALEAEIHRARAAGLSHLTHPYFGRVDLVRMMRLGAVHLEHHHRQVAAVRG